MKTPLWLLVETVIRINANLVAEHGGAGVLVRDHNLLNSALARPEHLLTYASQPPSLPELAAAYGYGLARNHAFLDGNKRTSWLAMYVFLDINGIDVKAPQAEVVLIMEAVASGNTDEVGLANFLAVHSRER